MKTKMFFLSVFMLVLLLICPIAIKAQSSTATHPKYKDLVAENPTADSDIKLVEDYLNSLLLSNPDKAKSLLADNYMGYGPSPADSSNAEQTINSWKENYKTQLNRKVDFQAVITLRILAGNYKGDWVDVWGNYSCNMNGKDITLPLQYTSKVANGKIVADMTYYDNLYIVKKLGYTVTPPELPK